VKTIGMLMLAAVLAVALGAMAVGCKNEPAPKAGEKAAPKSETPAKADASATPAAEIAQKLCPVMGNKIDPKIYVDYNGRRIYFCCAMCPPEFKKDPEKYIKKVDEQLAAGAATK